MKHPADVSREPTLDSLANERDRERRLGDLLSDEEQKDGLSQQDGNGHGQLLSSSCAEVKRKDETGGHTLLECHAICNKN